MLAPMQNSTNLPSPTLFPLSRCPACGYELTGLPNPGRCPECGGAYDNGTLILFGWPLSRFRSPGNTAAHILAICFGVFFCADGAIGVVATVATVVRRQWSGF